MKLLCKIFGHQGMYCKCDRCGEIHDAGVHRFIRPGGPAKTCFYCDSPNPNYEEEYKTYMKAQNKYHDWMVEEARKELARSIFRCIKCGTDVKIENREDSICSNCGKTYIYYGNGHRTYKSDNGSNPYYKEITCARCNKSYISNAGDIVIDSLSKPCI